MDEAGQGAGSAEAKPAKGRSTIAFPYMDISEAIKIGEGLLKGGGVPMTRDQLAAAMGQAPGSGSFNSKVNTARMFGVLETSAGKYQLTELGFEIVDQSRQREAMVTAFLNVELYRKAFEEYRGKRLPPKQGLENAFISWGVAPKQAANARIAFERSARMAGFFPNGDEERLVMPFGLGGATPAVAADEAPSPVTAIATATTPARAGAGSPAKPLEYQLIDLLQFDSIADEEEAAIWTLVRFLKRKKRDAPDEIESLIG